jgi:hypothetical protein
MDNQKQQVIERLQQANNILVTVSNNPSVDQLSACIGLTLALNKAGKHATAVFSGNVPSTIEFLQPEQTLEKNTDSLRDFIIALDKSKADKLRYKVEDRMVKIFITPYRTSISDKDLEFSQGDFNVDVVVALGVHNQQDLDQAITSHGRILHDATVMSVNVVPGAELGSVNWVDAGASSLSELGVQIVDAVDKKLMDGQIATALLTGIIAETERFSNQKTSPQTMSISAELMAAGANQQLVSTKLQEPIVVPEPPKPVQQPLATLPPTKPEEKPAQPPKPDDGTIEIDHEKKEEIPEAPETPKEPEDQQAPQIHIDEQGRLHPFGPPAPDADANLPKITPLSDSRKEGKSGLLTDSKPPILGESPMTANTKLENEDEPSTDPLSLPSVGLLNREPLPSQKGENADDTEERASGEPTRTGPSSMPKPDEEDIEEDENDMSIPPLKSPGVTPVGGTVQPSVNPLNPVSNGPQPSRTLSEIERDLHSPHIEQPSPNGSLPPAPTMPALQPPAPMQPTATFTPPAPMQQPAIQPPVPIVTPTPPANDVPTVDDARNAVEQALNSNGGNSTGVLDPITALNAQPLGEPISHNPQLEQAPTFTPPAPMQQPAQGPAPTMPAPQSQQLQPFSFEPPAPQPQAGVPGAGTTPPPVPPPMMPPSFPGNPQQ